MTREEAIAYRPAYMSDWTEILRCEVGSTAHGTGVGSDDLDMVSVMIPPRDKVFGLEPFDHYLFRTATERTGQSDARSEPGDVDLVFYSLRKFVGMARKGNPSILNIFFGPALYEDLLGSELRQSHGLFHTKAAGRQFIGYMNGERSKLTGSRSRPELVEKYGFDTKHAYHVIRLGIQGLEFLRRGRISVPLPEHVRDLLIDIRQGEHSQDKVLQWADELTADMTQALGDSDLPDKADIDQVDNLLIGMHEAAWERA